MEPSRLLDCLAADGARLRTVVAGSLDAPVPTCPGWSGTDLARHMGAVYLHKAAAMRSGRAPDPWPPQGMDQAEPLALLDRGLAELAAEFAARRPADPAWTWYGPDQSVGFWIRRMAQETVIHRIDAELAAGQPVMPVPGDLAADGVDEMLRVFAAFQVSQWPEDFAGALAGSPGRRYLIQAGDLSWRAATGPGVAFAVHDTEDPGGGADGPGGPAPDVTVSGVPEAVLRWMWHRESPGEPASVSVTGPPEAVAGLRDVLAAAAQ